LPSNSATLADANMSADFYSSFIVRYCIILCSFHCCFLVSY
jgi:hypothetical protein